MLELLKKENNETFARTENDAAALASTGSNCLDLFASIGALRAADEEEIRRRFVRAFAEDRTTALRILFYARDIRGGLGERRAFRVILAYLAVHAPEVVEKLLPLVAEYGRPRRSTERRSYSCAAASRSSRIICGRRTIVLIMKSSRPARCSSIAGHSCATIRSAIRISSRV